MLESNVKQFYTITLLDNQKFTVIDTFENAIEEVGRALFEKDSDLLVDFYGVKDLDLTEEDLINNNIVESKFGFFKIINVNVEMIKENKERRGK